MSDTTYLSIFELLTETLGSRLPPIQATKATLVDVSHLLEDIVLTEQLPAVICTGFQESSHWKQETARYREIANVAHQICIFAGGALPEEEDQRQIHVRLRGPDPLRQEWFLLVLTHEFAALLCGRDQLVPVAEEGDRMFATLWSFEPDVIADVMPVLERVVARERPDRLPDLRDAFQRFPPPVPQARLLSMLTTRLIDDLGRQHQTRIRLERTLAHESRLRSLGQVLSGVAHELNNPLQSVLGFGSLLLDEPTLSPASREDVEYLVAAAERARGIVQNLLQLARPNNETLALVQLDALVEKTLVFVRADARSAGIDLQIKSEPQLPPVMVNQIRIQQLIINLLTNAIQALAQHDGPRTLLVQVLRADQTHVALVVQDSGPGIPRELHARIFEPFFTTKQIGQGTGLGLSIVRTIVREHGGKLHLASESGGGTTFTITLPVAEGEAGMLPDAQPVSGQGHILVVDDDVQVKAVVQRTLERAGYTVRAEPTAAEALEAVAWEHYDAIICDLMMPGVDGIQFYEQLLNRQPHLIRRLIFMTGDVTRPANQEFIRRTVRPTLIKPFLPNDLLVTVRQVINANKT